jgi:hypothetical protein
MTTSAIIGGHTCADARSLPSACSLAPCTDGRIPAAAVRSAPTSRPLRCFAKPGADFSTGRGAKGKRFYDWAWIAYSDPARRRVSAEAAEAQVLVATDPSSPSRQPYKLATAWPGSTNIRSAAGSGDDQGGEHEGLRL